MDRRTPHRAPVRRRRGGRHHPGPHRLRRRPRPVRPRDRRPSGLTVALDHAGFPDPAAGDAGLRPVLALAELANVHLKISTHLFTSYAPHDPADVVDRLAGTFGDDRLLWGSDHPQTRTPDYPGMVTLARHALRRRPAAGQAAILGGNAERLWWS
ncbi:amidohydrolase family protein [Yinghuangia aomiensis]